MSCNVRFNTYSKYTGRRERRACSSLNLDPLVIETAATGIMTRFAKEKHSPVTRHYFDGIEGFVFIKRQLTTEAI